MDVIEFPVDKMEVLAETADCELSDWCFDKIELGLDPVFLVGILQHNIHYILTDMIEEE
jgi:hypothetical protein